MLKSHHQLFGDKFASLDTPLSMFRFLSFFFPFQTLRGKAEIFRHTHTRVQWTKFGEISTFIFMHQLFTLAGVGESLQTLHMWVGGQAAPASHVGASLGKIFGTLSRTGCSARGCGWSGGAYKHKWYPSEWHVTRVLKVNAITFPGQGNGFFFLLCSCKVFRDV